MEGAVMLYDAKSRLQDIHTLCREWHNAGRKDFERLFKNLDYDAWHPHTVATVGEWAILNEQLGDDPPIPCFGISPKDGNCYRTLRNGEIVLDKFIGNMKNLTGEALHYLRYH